MPVTLLPIALAISLSLTGIYAAAWRGMILHGPVTRLKNNIIRPICRFILHEEKRSARMAKLICKPLYECLICMSGFWTIVFFLIFRIFDWFYLPNVILMTAGINTIIVSLITPIIPDEEEND
jgi:hypothetical protein